MNKDLGSGFAIKIVGEEGNDIGIYDLVLYRYNKRLFTVSSRCYSRKTALYWYNIDYIQLKKIIIMADTVKDSKGTEDEQFFIDWLMELLKFWGTDNDLYNKLKKVIFDYLDN